MGRGRSRKLPTALKSRSHRRGRAGAPGRPPISSLGCLGAGRLRSGRSLAGCACWVFSASLIAQPSRSTSRAALWSLARCAE